VFGITLARRWYYSRRRGGDGTRFWVTRRRAFRVHNGCPRWCIQPAGDETNSSGRGVPERFDDDSTRHQRYGHTTVIRRRRRRPSGDSGNGKKVPRTPISFSRSLRITTIIRPSCSSFECVCASTIVDDGPSSTTFLDTRGRR